MKNILTTLLLLILAVPFNARTYCIVAGISNYNNEEVANLLLSSDDAKRIKAVYKQHYQDEAVVRLLTGRNATSTEILRYVDMLKRLSKADDQVVFFFSGHGVRDSLVTYDTNEKLAYSTLFNALNEIECASIVVYVDACFSGTMLNSLREMENNRRFIAFASSRFEETSLEMPTMPSGYFTKALIDGLNGAADADGNKQVTARELFVYVRTNVTHQVDGLPGDNEQHPNLSTSESNHDVVLMTLE